MPSTLLYKFPETRQQLTKVFDAIPTDWEYVTAALVAPRRLIEQNRVFINSDASLSRRLISTLSPITASPGWARDENQPTSDVAEMYNSIIFGEKLPHTVTMEAGGYWLGMSEALKILRYALFLGYTGGLEARKTDGTSNGHILAGIEIEFDEGMGGLAEAIGDSPPHVGAGWFEQYGGSKDDVRDFVDVVEGLGLERLVPETA